MACDKNLAERVLQALGHQPSLAEKEMFGGIGFLIPGNLACGVHDREPIVRLGPARHDAAPQEPHVRPFDPSGGKPPRGWLLVQPSGLKVPAQIRRWVERGVEFARSLPSK